MAEAPDWPRLVVLAVGGDGRIGTGAVAEVVCGDGPVGWLCFAPDPAPDLTAIGDLPGSDDVRAWFSSMDACRGQVLAWVRNGRLHWGRESQDRVRELALGPQLVCVGGSVPAWLDSLLQSVDPEVALRILVAAGVPEIRHAPSPRHELTAAEPKPSEKARDARSVPASTPALRLSKRIASSSIGRLLWWLGRRIVPIIFLVAVSAGVAAKTAAWYLTRRGEPLAPAVATEAEAPSCALLSNAELTEAEALCVRLHAHSADPGEAPNTLDLQSDAVAFAAFADGWAIDVVANCGGDSACRARGAKPIAAALGRLLLRRLVDPEIVEGKPLLGRVNKQFSSSVELESKLEDGRTRQPAWDRLLSEEPPLRIYILREQTLGATGLLRGHDDLAADVTARLDPVLEQRSSVSGDEAQGTKGELPPQRAGKAKTTASAGKAGPKGGEKKDKGGAKPAANGAVTAPVPGKAPAAPEGEPIPKAPPASAPAGNDPASDGGKKE